MKRFSVVSSQVMLVLWLLLVPVVGHAGVLEDYEQSHKMYIAATACMAAYSDRVAGFSIDTLKRDGWEVESYAKDGSKVNARFILAKKIQPDDNQPTYILAVVGTETIKDVLTNLLVGKVYFAGRTPEEFEANAKRKGMPDTLPKVHQGYNQFVQTALSAEGKEGKDTAKKQLIAMLLEQQTGKLYLVGHSMGGATATLAGARLVSVGVRPEQIEIITFGAPAVGNEAFRQKFEPVLNLTRIVTSGDPMIKILQDLIGGYKQVGQEIKWEVPDSATVTPHEMTMYFDLAIKHYYWDRHQAMQAGAIPALVDQRVPAVNVASVYVAPTKNDLSEKLQEEFFYMREALQDEYRRTFPGYIIDTAKESEAVFKKAAAAGCQWVLVTRIQDHMIKNTQSGYYITLEETVYNVNTGDVVSVSSYGRITRATTPLQALMHDASNVGRDSHDWLVSLNKQKESLD